MFSRGAPQDAAKYDGDHKWPCMRCRLMRLVNSFPKVMRRDGRKTVDQGGDREPGRGG